MPTTETLLEQIGEKLDKILGVLLVSDKGIDEQIRILRSLDYDWGFVGAVTGLTADAARMRKPKTKAKSKK